MSKLRAGLSESAWAKSLHCIRFLLTHLALCVAFSIAISWIEMRVHVTRAGPNYVNEFVGMYLVLGFVYGQLSCVLALPVHVLAYLKVPLKRAHRIALAASVAASLGVWCFFHLLNS